MILLISMLSHVRAQYLAFELQEEQITSPVNFALRERRVDFQEPESQYCPDFTRLVTRKGA